MDLDEFITEISDLGLPADPVLKFLRTIYIAIEVPYEREIKTDQYPHPTEKLFEVKGWIVKLLQRYDLLVKGMSDMTRYGKSANVRYYRLTGEGYKLGSQAFIGHLKSVSENLPALLESFPERLLLVVALKAVRPHVEFAYPVEIDVEGQDFEIALSRILSSFETMMLGPGELEALYKRSKRAFGDLTLVFNELKERRVEIYEPRVYDIFMSHILLEYNGRVHAAAVQLMEELGRLGLSARIPKFDSEGDYIGDSWRAPPEVAELLLSYSDADLSEARKLFLAADMLARELTEGLSKRELLEALRKIGVSEAEVKMSLDVLYGEGITSRFNETGGPSSPAFIILDEGKAKGEIRRILDDVESVILFRASQ